MCDPSASQYDLGCLRDRIAPAGLLHEPVITSTNDWAKREVESGMIRAPTLFVADRQSAGRGRGTNTWWSATGNIAATFVVTQNSRISFGLVPLLAGLAVRRVLVRFSSCEQIGLKWPNDLVVDGRKTAGLLCERLQRVDLIGVGVNVNAGRLEAPAELRERITSLGELTGTAWDLTDVVCEMARELHDVLSVECDAATRDLMQEYSRHHWPTGKNVELVDTDRASRITGRCEGFDSLGRLLIATEQGVRPLLTGSIVSVTCCPDTS
jgi:BirA family biotin operon repressor/biotin-[acetyl-CoA-carboxylase] ligase